MVKKFVETVVGGAIGVIALYIVGTVAYNAGYDTAQAECHYEEVRRKTEALSSDELRKTDILSAKAPKIPDEASNAVAVPKKAHRPFSPIDGIRRMIGRKESTIGRLVRHPEEHAIEAFVEGDELKVNVKPRNAH